MRVRPLAYAILLFAGTDLLLLTLAPVFGWVPVAADATQTVVILAIAFFLAIMAMLGSLSVLATDFGDDAKVFVLDAGCGECGRRARHTLAFCDHCGASA